jgi:hypothetical protein
MEDIAAYLVAFAFIVVAARYIFTVERLNKKTPNRGILGVLVLDVNQLRDHPSTKANVLVMGSNELIEIFYVTDFVRLSAAETSFTGYYLNPDDSRSHCCVVVNNDWIKQRLVIPQPLSKVDGILKRYAIFKDKQTWQSLGLNP